MKKIYSFYFPLVIILFILQALYAQDSQNTTLLGHWADGKCRAIDVEGAKAYFGNGGNLMISDISDPSNPVEVGKIVLPSLVKDVAVSGSYAYVAAYYEGLYIIDISDPSNPSEIGCFVTGDRASGVAVNSGYAYVADGADGLRIIDVQDPINPSEKGFFDTGGFASDVKVNGGMAYIADGTAGLRIIDITDPANPLETGYYDTDWAHALDLAGTYAYVADGSNGLFIVDVNDPSNPDSVSLISTNGEAHDVSISGNTAYVAAYNGGVRIIDVSEPANPSELGFFDEPSLEYAVAVAVKNDTAYVAYTSDGLRIVDCSDPVNTAEIGNFDTRDYSHGVAVNNGYAYIANFSDGLRILDVNDSANPSEIGYFDTPGFARSVVKSGDFAYIADDYGGLRIINVSDPTNPSETSFLDTLGNAFDVVVNDGLAYVGARWDGLRIIDVNDPANPTETGSFDTGDQAFGVAISGNLAFVADGATGLRIIDVTDPANPSEIGFFDTGGTSYGITVCGNLAFLADGSEGLRIIDVSDPANASEVGFFNTGGLARDVSVNGEYAYVTDNIDGLRIIDVSDPANPNEVGYYDTGHEAIGLADTTNLVYVADGEDGLYIIRNDLTGVSTSISVLSPNGGEIWDVDSQHEITWNSTNVSQVDIEYSTDSGGSWDNIADTVNSSTGSYLWTIPDTPSSNCLVRISDTSDPSISDTSDMVFTINSPQSIFGPQQIITTNADGAISVYASDLDSDGDIDVLSASHEDDKITWYENQGTNSFSAHVISDSVDGASSIFAINMDNDQDIDVVSAADFGNKIVWYENSGTQSFIAHNVGSIGSPSCVYPIDLDNDGDVDLVAISYQLNGISWFENDGSQSFTKHLIDSDGDGYSTYAADVDKDGDVDILSAIWSNKIGWYENDGAQNFTLHIITSDLDGSRSVFATDVDGDGDMDILSASQNDDKIAWYENDGSQNFISHIITTTADGARSVYAIDLDKDGDIDVLSASYDNDIVAWYENDGSQNFTYHMITNNADGAFSVYAIDLDGDSDVDVLSASVSDDKVAWYENLTNPVQSIEVLTPNGGEDWQAGSQHDITWNSANTSGTVNIEYTIDNGLNWSAVSSGETDDGSFSWTIPSSASTECKVRVRDTDGNPGDESDNVFTISEQPGIIWQNVLNVSDENSNTTDLTFGTATDATNGFDAAYDQYAPPPPPDGNFDGRLKWDGESYIKDFRGPIASDPDNEITWVVEFQYSTGGDPITLNWDNANFPADGYFQLVDDITGDLVNVDMKAQSSYTVTNTSIDRLKIIYKSTTTFDMAMMEGWNMIGLPLEVEDNYYLTLFPNAIEGTLYKWTGSYQDTTHLDEGIGYWLRMPAEEVVTIEGTEISTITIDMMEGWNMIAGPSGDVLLNSVEDPDNILIENTLYDFIGYYVLSDTIKQGKGYWLRTSATGQITISTSTSESKKTLAKEGSVLQSMEDYPFIEIKDANRCSRTLYLNVELDNPENILSYSLPPLPPSGAFDVRFTNGYYITESDECTIKLQTNSFPVTVNLKGLTAEEGYAYVITAYSGGTTGESYLLDKQKSVQITNSATDRLTLTKKKIIPKEFSVFQNYPNPFNPATEIRYQLEEDSNVEISIYNVMGQKVKTLVSEKQKPGMYKIRWDGQNASGSKLSSGVYIYTVIAGKHKVVKKMLLIK